MRAVIEKSIAKGSITAPPSKSICHRLIIAASLCEGESVLSGISLCADCIATINCLKALGVDTELDGDRLTVRGNGFKNPSPTSELYCKESGSTLRFLIPLALLGREKTVFTGAKRLIERPLGVYEEICKERGMLFERDSDGIKVKGVLKSGEFRVVGNISSQFITGLMFALSKAEGNSKIIITTDIESKSYIDLTIDAMRTFGAEVGWESERVIYIKGNCKYKAKSLTVEGDYSGSAFTDAFNLFGGEVQTLGLKENSIQGDRAYKELFPLLNSGTPTVSIKDCPDLGPILFAIAAAKNGAVFTDTARLRIKESDRAAVMAEELTKFGAKIIVNDNSVVIEKAVLHAPEELLYGHNDHRIVMSLTVLLSLFGGEIEGAEAVNKSYGDFFEHIKKLGIAVQTYEA